MSFQRQCESMIFAQDESRPVFFCALAYSSDDLAPARPEDSNVLILLLGEEDGSVRLFFNPDWTQIVSEDDQPYIQQLREDFLLRVKVDPDALLRQASSLSVGPLITHSTGNDISDNPGLFDTVQSFTEM